MKNGYCNNLRSNLRSTGHPPVKKFPPSSPPTQVEEEPEIRDQPYSTETSLSLLPVRPRGCYASKFSQTKLLTNLYKINFNQNLQVHIYSVKIDPNIQHDSTKKLNNIINSAKNQLKGSIGTNFVICGRTLYSCQAPKNLKEPIVAPAKFGTEKYTLTLQHVRKVEMSKLSSANKKDSFLPINFLNNLIKRFFAGMNYVQVGTSGKYINPNSKYSMSSAGVFLFNGYEASISMLEDGLYLRVDGLTRIVQDKSVLDLINKIYVTNSHLDKDAKRNLVKEELIGKTVVANYGNSRHWKITDVIFDVDFDKTMIAEDTNMSYSEYYQKNYGLTIINKKQPLLEAVYNTKKKGSALLIPELLLISGLPDNFDERKRREISEKTIISPEQKLQRIEALISSFNSQNQTLSSDALSESLGIEISNSIETVNALSLPPPQLQLGGQGCVEQNKVANFQLFNKPLYKTDTPLNIAAFIPDDYDFSGVEKLVSSTCKSFGMSQHIIKIKIKFNDPKRYLREIQNYFEDANGKLDDRNLCWFVLPGNQKSIYPTLKRLCINAKKPKLSQMSLTSTLAKKGFASIVTKILIQAASKVGNVPWVPKISKNFVKDFMLIGIDICKDGEKRKESVVSFCCSLNNDGSKFHSNYYYQSSSTKYNEKIKEITAECLAAYTRTNNRLPSEVFILKSGCSETEKQSVMQKEVSDVKHTLSQLQNACIKLTFMIVDLGSKQKFFLEGKSVINPYYGTLINSKVVGKNYDFYMISQQCNRGTVKPIHYEVIHSDSQLEEGVLQEFIYSQCFNYMNWSGSIRVPGVLQYAKKLAKLVSEHLNCSMESESLNDNLFFI